MDDKQRAYSEWLVIRCQQGDKAALHELLRLWRPRYLAYARQRLGDPQPAADVVQDALLGICRNLHRLADGAAFPGWSYTIVDRRCVDWLRRHLRESDVFDVAADSDAIAQNTNTDAALDSSRLLASLKPELASLVRLYYLEELSVREIAEVLAIPVGTVKSRLHQARKLLQDKLEN